MQRDILIIGCGIFGAAIAWSLGRRGLGPRVLIVDRQPPASGATSRAAGLVTQVRADPTLQALAGETLAAIELLKTHFGEDVGCHRVGALHIGPLAQQAALAHMLAACTAAGIRGQWLDKAQVLAQSPWLNPEAFDIATFFPEECFVDPYLLSSAYLRGAQQMGVQLRLDTRVAHIQHLAGAVTGVALTVTCSGALRPGFRAAHPAMPSAVSMATRAYKRGNVPNVRMQSSLKTTCIRFQMNVRRA